MKLFKHTWENISEGINLYIHDAHKLVGALHTHASAHLHHYVGWFACPMNTASRACCTCVPLMHIAGTYDRSLKKPNTDKYSCENKIDKAGAAAAQTVIDPVAAAALLALDSDEEEEEEEKERQEAAGVPAEDGPPPAMGVAVGGGDLPKTVAVTTAPAPAPSALLWIESNQPLVVHTSDDGPRSTQVW
eukprot:SAG11_NODE_789_length_7139_cov_5.205607_5_plen_189_part_00